MTPTLCPTVHSWPSVRAVALLGVLLFSAGCAAGGAVAPLTPDRPAPPLIDGQGPGLTLVESVPLETVLDSPTVPQACDVWTQQFDQARSGIDLEQFYFTEAPNTCMEKVQQALARAAGRGVKLRVVADARFAKTYPDTLTRLKALPGAGVWTLDLKPYTDGVQHAKFFVIDPGTPQAEAYVGSQNFDWRSLEHIRELGVRIQEPALVTPLEALFSLDHGLAEGSAALGTLRDAPWQPLSPRVRTRFQGKPVIAQVLASPLRLLPGGVAWELPALIQTLEQARSAIRLEWHSLAVLGYDKTRWTLLDQTLRKAAARGVKVELIVADWCKKEPKLEAILGLASVPGIDVYFSTIPPWSGGFIDYARVIHTKALVVDGRISWVGSSNGSADYFFSSRNVGLWVEGESFAQAIEAWMDVLRKSPYLEKVDPTAQYTAPKTR